MNINTTIIFLMLIIMFGLTVWGLFNKRRSILIILADVLVILTTGIGALYAWGESHSLPWAIGYFSFFILGIVSIVRQIRHKKWKIIRVYVLNNWKLHFKSIKIRIIYIRDYSPLSSTLPGSQRRMCTEAQIIFDFKRRATTGGLPIPHTFNGL